MTMSTVITIRMKSALITFSNKHLILLQTASSEMLQVLLAINSEGEAGVIGQD